MTIKELLLSSEKLVNSLVEEIDSSDSSLKDAEERILQFVNRVGQVMTDDVVKNIKEPTVENAFLLMARWPNTMRGEGYGLSTDLAERRFGRGGAIDMRAGGVAIIRWMRSLV